MCMNWIQISLMPGFPVFFFEGLNQGDPFPPLLFVLVADVWGRLLLLANNNGLVSGLGNVVENEKIVSLQFLDSTQSMLMEIILSRLIMLLFFFFEELSGLLSF